MALPNSQTSYLILNKARPSSTKGDDLRSRVDPFSLGDMYTKRLGIRWSALQMTMEFP